MNSIALSPSQFVIIDDCDAPSSRMICQFVPGVGYCYINRLKQHISYDGMRGANSTPIESFGVDWKIEDGVVKFVVSDRPSTATYRDGKPRYWQDSKNTFGYRLLTRADVRKKVKRAA